MSKGNKLFMLKPIELVQFFFAYPSAKFSYY
jgi:hypothetical protein